MPRTPARRAPKRLQTYEFELKKRPTQARALATFDAIMTAGARVLAARGYAGMTTNHVAEAAGVGIASLYEYVPGKDAIVAEIAARMIDRVVRSLEASIVEILAMPPDRIVAAWIERIYATLVRERALVTAFVEEVPYTRHLPMVRAISPRLLELSRGMQSMAGVRLANETASLLLMINLVTSTILQLVVDPPSVVTPDELLAALASRVSAWIATG